MTEHTVRSLSYGVVGLAVLVPSLQFAPWPGPRRPIHRVAPALVFGVQAATSLTRAVAASGFDPGAVTRRTEVCSLT